MSRKILLTFTLIAVLVAATIASMRAVAEPAPLTRAGSTFDIDPVHSTVLFSIRHMGVGQFFGRFNAIEGSFTIDGDALGSTSVSADVIASSVDTANKGRDRHLKGGDFFDSGQFAKITFRSKKAKATGDTTFELEGDFTMLGVTKPVTFQCEFLGEGKGPRGDDIAGMTARAKIKRSDYKMNYGLNNGALGDEVELIISVEGKKQ